MLNLGVEGMMLVGAVMGFWAMQRAPGPTGLVLLLAALTAAFAGLVMSPIHAFLVITLRASQIVSGLALTIFAGGLGLSSYLGNDLGLADVPPRHQFGDIDVFGLKDVPVVGPVLFHQSALVYASWALVVLVALYLVRTRFGLNVRAVGESPGAADAMGINVAATGTRTSSPAARSRGSAAPATASRSRPAGPPATRWSAAPAGSRSRSSSSRSGARSCASSARTCSAGCRAACPRRCRPTPTRSSRSS